MMQAKSCRYLLSDIVIRFRHTCVLETMSVGIHRIMQLVVEFYRLKQQKQNQSTHARWCGLVMMTRMSVFRASPAISARFLLFIFLCRHTAFTCLKREIFLRKKTVILMRVPDSLQRIEKPCVWTDFFRGCSILHRNATLDKYGHLGGTLLL